MRKAAWRQMSKCRQRSPWAARRPALHAQPAARPSPASRSQPSRRGNPCSLMGFAWRSARSPWRQNPATAERPAWLARQAATTHRRPAPAHHERPQRARQKEVENGAEELPVGAQPAAGRTSGLLHSALRASRAPRRMPRFAARLAPHTFNLSCIMAVDRVFLNRSGAWESALHVELRNISAFALFAPGDIPPRAHLQLFRRARQAPLPHPRRREVQGARRQRHRLAAHWPRSRRREEDPRHLRHGYRHERGRPRLCSSAPSPDPAPRASSPSSRVTSARTPT